MKIARGLIIADPWIGYILDGSKDWEMRSSSASHRGWFGLIRKGTGAVYGVAKLIEVGAPLTQADMIAAIAHHRIPEHMIRSGEVLKWNTPWKLAGVRRFGRPVPYRHKSGAVTWVQLDEEAILGIESQLRIEPTAIDAATSDHLGSAATTKLDVSQDHRTQPLGIGSSRAAPVSAPPAMPHTSKTTDRIPSPPEPVSAALREEAARLLGDVAITDANITYNHIYLGSFFHRFPSDVIGGPNKDTRAKRDLTIEWGGADPVQTDIDGKKKIFRARGWVRDFFRLHRARAGDRVTIEEIAPYRYRVCLGQ